MISRGFTAVSMAIAATAVPLVAQIPGAAAAARRTLPAPQAGAFAHVFTHGDTVVVRLPPNARGKAVRWATADERGRPLASGDLEAGAETLSLGKADTGWYRIGFADPAGAEVGWTSAAVLARASGPPRPDSPVCADTANAWFARQDATRLCGTGGAGPGQLGQGPYDVGRGRAHAGAVCRRHVL